MSLSINKLSKTEAAKIVAAPKAKATDPAIVAAVKDAKPGEAFKVALGDWNANRAKRHFKAAAKAVNLSVSFPHSGEEGILLVVIGEAPVEAEVEQPDTETPAE